MTADIKTAPRKVMTDEQRDQWHKTKLFPIELWGDARDSTPLVCPMPDRKLLRALAESIPEHIVLSGWYPGKQSGGFQSIYADDFSGMGRQLIAAAPSSKSYFGELAEFMAAASPRTVLRLLDRIDELERAVLSAIDSERKDDSRDARRYREARQHPYLYGIGNPEPWQFDAYIDAALEIAASKSSEGAMP